MRHGKKFNHLGRKTAHRKAMLSNMACSLIEHKRIKTTVAKAKALRKFVEPLITKSKSDTTHSRRIVFSYLRQKDVVTELFGDVASKVSQRPGGYTRILKLGNRLGDNAQMCFIELVDYNEDYTTNESSKKSKSKRRRSTKKASANVEATVQEAVVEDTATLDDVPKADNDQAKEQVENNENPKKEEQKGE